MDVDDTIRKDVWCNVLSVSFFTLAIVDVAVVDDDSDFATCNPPPPRTLFNETCILSLLLLLLCRVVNNEPLLLNLLLPNFAVTPSEQTNARSTRCVLPNFMFVAVAASIIVDFISVGVGYMTFFGKV